MSAAAGTPPSSKLPIDWAASTSSQGWRGCCLRRAATASIGIASPLFQSRWESTTNRVLGSRAASSDSSRAASLRQSRAENQEMVRPWRRASSWQAATTPGCSASLSSKLSPGSNGNPHSGNTQPLVTFSVRLSRCGGTPQSWAKRRLRAEVSASTNGHTSRLKGPSRCSSLQQATIASSDGVGRGPWPP